MDDQPANEPPPKTLDLTAEEAKKWRGKWDVVITYPILEDEEAKEPKNVQRAKRRDVLIRRMRKCGLVVVRQVSMDESYIMLKITAPYERLEREADRLDINIPLKSEAMMTREVEQNDDVKGKWGKFVDRVLQRQKPVGLCYARYDKISKHLFSTVDDRFFRSMDRQRLIVSILESERWRDGCYIDVAEEIKSHVFESIVFLRTPGGQQRVVQEWLGRPWYYLEQPLPVIRDYFGEKIAFYFAFISTYTRWLIYLSFFGIITFMVCWLDDGNPRTLNLDHDINIFYGIVLCLWCTLFLEVWKRNQASLAFKFNIADYASRSQARPKFKGDWVKGRVTPNGIIKFEEMADISPDVLEKIDEYVLWYPPALRAIRYFVGTPIIASFAIAVIAGTASLLAFKTFLEDNKVTAGGVIGSIANAIFIIVMNTVYQYVALGLNHFENHRTDADFENALIAKTFIFQFINSYIALFFIAFVKGSPLPSWAVKFENGDEIPSDQLPVEFRPKAKIFGQNIGVCNQSSCMLDLFFQLAIIVIVKQLLSNFAEFGFPWLKGKFVLLRRLTEVVKKEKNRLQQATTGQAHATGKELDDDVLERMPFFEEQVTLPKFGGTFYEYNELLIQFGYMTMFATSFPLASVFSLINNTLEIRIDASKILFATQRPEYEGACDIGTWLTVLEGINFLAVMTNTAIICFTSTALKGEWVDRTTSDYRSCVADCSPYIANITSSWSAYSTNSSSHDAWVEIALTSNSVEDTSSCLFDCACDGRCMSFGSRFLVFVVTEHILIFIKMLLDYYIPDVPKNIARTMVWKDLVEETIKIAKERDQKGITSLEGWDSDKDSVDANDIFDDEEDEPSKKIRLEANAFSGSVKALVKGKGHEEKSGPSSSSLPL